MPSLDHSTATRVARYFDRVAPFYDTVTAAPGVYSPNRVVRGLLHGRLRAGIRAIDIGAGTGQTIAVLVPPLRAADVLAVDPSGAMLGACAARFPGASVFMGTLDEARTAGLNLSAGLITCVGAFEFIAEPSAFLASCASCLQPGGLLVFTHEVLDLTDPARTAPHWSEGDGAGRLEHRRDLPADVSRWLAEAGLLTLLVREFTAYEVAGVPVVFRAILANRHSG